MGNLEFFNESFEQNYSVFVNFTDQPSNLNIYNVNHLLLFNVTRDLDKTLDITDYEKQFKELLIQFSQVLQSNFTISLLEKIFTYNYKLDQDITDTQENITRKEFYKHLSNEMFGCFEDGYNFELFLIDIGTSIKYMEYPSNFLEIYKLLTKEHQWLKIMTNIKQHLNNITYKKDYLSDILLYYDQRNKSDLRLSLNHILQCCKNIIRNYKNSFRKLYDNKSNSKAQLNNNNNILIQKQKLNKVKYAAIKKMNVANQQFIRWINKNQQYERNIYIIDLLDKQIYLAKVVQTSNIPFQQSQECVALVEQGTQNNCYYQNFRYFMENNKIESNKKFEITQNYKGIYLFENEDHFILQHINHINIPKIIPYYSLIMYMQKETLAHLNIIEDYICNI